MFSTTSFRTSNVQHGLRSETFFVLLSYIESFLKVKQEWMFEGKKIIYFFLEGKIEISLWLKKRTVYKAKRIDTRWVIFEGFLTLIGIYIAQKGKKQGEHYYRLDEHFWVLEKSQKWVNPTLIAVLQYPKRVKIEWSLLSLV